ncbi:Transmembrane Protease Serine 11F [Manis pentadactyla]|nr:Transmembrane Protease Serine 11F [Manis pentadactyla]
MHGTMMPGASGTRRSLGQGKQVRMFGEWFVKAEIIDQFIMCLPVFQKQTKIDKRRTYYFPCKITTEISFKQFSVYVVCTSK